MISDILTSSLVPVKPYQPSAASNPSRGQTKMTSEPIFEVDEFLKKDCPKHHFPVMEYTNHCYVYPKFLNYDNQKTFAKVRSVEGKYILSWSGF